MEIHPRIQAAIHYFEGSDVLQGHVLKCAITVVLGARPSKREIIQMAGDDRPWTRQNFIFNMEKYVSSSDDTDIIKKLYLIFDVRNRGFIDFTDFEATCQEAFPKMSRNEATSAFLTVDTYGSGRITLNQFEKLMELAM
jgi:Ca2+-binding EF-hand superfamily protein